MNKSDVISVLDKVYKYSQDKGFKGHNKHDGLNSPILRAVLGWSKWPRIIAVQVVTRSPINLRQLLAVPHTFNPKGIALFIRGTLNLYETTGEQCYLDEAIKLTEILDKTENNDFSGSAWGYQYPWQDPGFFAPSGMPNAVVSSFVCQAYLRLFEVTGDNKYLEKVASTLAFFFNDLVRLKDTPEELCLSYMPVDMSMRVMDVSILIGAVVTRYTRLSGNRIYQDQANRLVTYVINQQTSEGAWFYTDPPSDSHITHDNYHTGFILDALSEYMSDKDDFSHQKVYDKGLQFYAERLFTAKGAPKWMYNKDFPYDIHGAAQGIITFARHKAEFPQLGGKVLKWAMTNMYAPEGRFYYQKTSLFTKKFTLLRWCNAWMYFALSTHLKHIDENK
ncbi:MAG: hypothetical protein GJ680_05120 [Alteromonadaceae bacterium]|nr:hypothetical protein [Alteromonadaceae bacterium]